MVTNIRLFMQIFDYSNCSRLCSRQFWFLKCSGFRTIDDWVSQGELHYLFTGLLVSLAYANKTVDDDTMEEEEGRVRVVGGQK
ncbi:unnamed protein product [Enterobius vermicularis]|uniref:Ovule protein n=1 Tax=Enterobius vermicularis TaxID=51028 RepID=A0A0N4VLS6_ENTVE|nr:unnamed protein product [Enterobius vermicularis]